MANSVKVIMGFLELAAAFKFISNSDLVWNWNILMKLVLLLWIIIIFMISMYSIGLILFPHDTKPNTISLEENFYLLLQFHLVLLINWYILR